MAPEFSGATAQDTLAQSKEDSPKSSSSNLELLKLFREAKQPALQALSVGSFDLFAI
jgi:hypothetical protein